MSAGVLDASDVFRDLRMRWQIMVRFVHISSSPQESEQTRSMERYKKSPSIRGFCYTTKDGWLRMSLVSVGRQDSGSTDMISSVNQGRMP